MSDLERIKPLAADSVANLLTAGVKRADGKDATAFKQQALGLKDTHRFVYGLEEYLDDVKTDLDAARSDLIQAQKDIEALQDQGGPGPANPFPASG